jgi:phosphonate dehydrogenase
VTRPRIVVTQWVQCETVARLSSLGDVVTNETREPLAPQELGRRCRDADAIMAFMPDRIDAGFLEDCKHLKVVAAALKGFDNFDVAACTRRGVWLTIVPDLLSVPTAELAIGLLIALIRHVAAGDRLVRSGRFAGWRPQLYGLGLAGSRAGLLGFGRVAEAAAERLVAFGTEVVYHDRARRPPEDERRLGVRPLPLSELLATSDFVLPFLPLEESTLHLLDADRLALMKPGAVLVNCGRGSVVDEEAVATSLETGRLAGYAADVFEMEDWGRADRPRSISPRLLAMPDCTLFTPHLGSAVARIRGAIELFAAEQIRQALEGGRPSAAVNDIVG